ncbi:MAG: hypothetical protein ACRDM1_01970 [Gaiellaceae bacterium]
MARIALIGLLVCLATAGAVQAANVGHRAFYLTVRPGQCLIAGRTSGAGRDKTVLVVPCSDPRHRFEVYAVRHGGWGHGKLPPPSTVKLIMRSVCLAAYQQVAGHPMPAGGGWDAYAPDAGAEQARYGDKIICSYVHYPTLSPLGAGRHIH